jgi:hypothetical protein
MPIPITSFLRDKQIKTLIAAVCDSTLLTVTRHGYRVMEESDVELDLVER